MHRNLQKQKSGEQAQRARDKIIEAGPAAIFSHAVDLEIQKRLHPKGKGRGKGKASKRDQNSAKLPKGFDCTKLAADTLATGPPLDLAPYVQAPQTASPLREQGQNRRTSRAGAKAKAGGARAQKLPNISRSKVKALAELLALSLRKPKPRAAQQIKKAERFANQRAARRAKATVASRSDGKTIFEDSM